MSDLFPPLDQGVRSLAPELDVLVALTLTQPWATLMDIGAKLNETRSWPTKYRGWIGIHAAKGYPKECRLLRFQDPFAQQIDQAGYAGRDLPTGCLIGVCRVVDCVRTETIREHLTDLERAFGDYSDGRWAWLTANFHRLREPIPMKGALSIWKLPRTITETDIG